MAEINVGSNANLLKGAIDSHDTQINNNDNRIDNSVTNNTTNNTINNNTTHQTIYEACRTQQEIMQDNENEFIKAVRERVADGLTRQEEAELEQIARDYKIDPLLAREIIEAERKSAEILSDGQGNEYYAGKVLQNIFDAVNANKIDVIKRLFRPVEELSKSMSDANLQYYHYMLFASLNPAGCTVSFVNHHTDNYWQLFWTCIAYVKLGQVHNAEALMPRLGGFGGPHGDIDLLEATINLHDLRHAHSDYARQQLQTNLQSAVEAGMSEQLSPLWYALQEHSKPEQRPEEWYAFYVETTLAEFSSAREKSMQKFMPQMPTPPQMPKFDPQAVQLKQSQGWSPMQAARQMGLGQMPTMQDMQAQLNAMRSSMMCNPLSGNMPPMPGMSTPPPMPQGMPPMPQAPQMSAPAAPVDELVVPEPSPAPATEVYPQYGIIFTDSLALANKYGCEVQEVYDVLNEFINNSAAAQQHWYLLDAANYRQQMGRDPYWGDYNEILSNYIYENGFQIGVATPVFIIGGGDVIPVPQLENPQYGGLIPTDMGYCFSTTFFSDLWESDRHISTDYVRNSVSRLPLECGSMSTTLRDDLLSYFNLCSLATEGIELKGVAMAANVEWTDNSVTMSQHLPLIYTNTTDEEETYKRMYMCPKLIATAADGAEVDKKVLADYKQALQQAGMLLFNLHGSDSKGQSGFYCNGAYCCPESFNIKLMKQSSARVFNTVACFGARFDGYKRGDSMLLSALLGGGKLLYAGSTVAVPMICDDDQNYPEGVTQYPGSGSEKFMPLYCYYQFCGLPAGQAMMQAKLDYFNTFRHIERDDFSLATVLMFGLYGNPMLHVKARQDVIDAAQRYEVLPRLPQSKAVSAPVRTKRIKQLISKEQLQGSKSLLEQLRGCVDENLTIIHGIVQQNLYQQLGLDPRWLCGVSSFEMPDEAGELLQGYLYSYDDDNKYGRKSIIEVSSNGDITRKITFK